MKTPILSTKLFIPGISPGLVVRPRLIRRLHGVLNHKLTLVSAQAGFGKTTLISHWLHSKHPPLSTTWLSLEEAENDPVRFWDYFTAALQTIHPGIGEEALIYLHSSEPGPIESILTSLINDLAVIKEDFIIVLDDYQFIHSETVHNAVSFLLDHLPPRFHIIITTRIDPPLPLSNYRGKGSLLEIRSDDLRFSRDEASILFAEMESPDLSEEDVTILNNKAEGWVVGLKMAALAMRGHEDSGLFISGFNGSQRYIMDYLVDEVLRRQSREIYEFLLQTSVLEKLNAPLCDAVTAESNGQRMIHYLEKNNLFLEPLDTSGEWYRYHHLFCDLLRHQLRVEYGDIEVKERHRRACIWYESYGLLDESINHALTAQEWEEVMRMVRAPGIYMRIVGTETMLNWLKQIPEKVMRTNTLVYFNYIWALQNTGQLENAEDCLKYLDTIAANDRLLRGRIANVRANTAFRKNDWLLGEQLSQKVLELLDPRNIVIPDADYQADYATALLMVGILHFNRGDFVEAEPLLEKSLEICRDSGRTSFTGQHIAYLSVIAQLRGRTHQAIKLVQEVIDRSEDYKSTAMAHVVAGGIYYEWNDLKSSTNNYEQAMNLLQLSKTPPKLGLEQTYLYLARSQMAMGLVDQALGTLAKADQITPDFPEDKARNAAYHLTIALLQGDAESISKWDDKLAQYQYEILPWDAPAIVHYRSLLRKGKALALKRGQAVYDQQALQGQLANMMHVRIGLSLLWKEEIDRSMEYLAEALDLGEPEGFIRSFVDFGMEIAPLLREAITRGINKDYARKLLGIIETEDHQRRALRVKARIVSQPSGLISEREIEVLQLVAQGYSNQQIASRLSVSLGTVKTHVHHLFQKLDAVDRLQVVNRARELNLI